MAQNIDKAPLKLYTRVKMSMAGVARPSTHWHMITNDWEIFIMDTFLLKEFITLSEFGNFQIASEELHISQSALSKHIKKLEEELEVPLFDRTNYGISLNEYGITFQNYALQICHLADESIKTLGKLRTENDKKFCIGFMELHAHYGLIETIALFRKLNPDIEVSMVEARGEQLRTMLDSNICDFIFSADFPDNEDKYRKSFYNSDKIIVVLPERHPLANRKVLRIEDLKNESFIIHNTTLELRLLNEYYNAAGIDLSGSLHSTKASTILRMIRQNLGISIISKACVLSYNLAGLVLVDFEPRITFDICMFSLKRHKPAPSMKRFIKFVEEQQKANSILALDETS